MFLPGFLGAGSGFAEAQPRLAKIAQFIAIFRLCRRSLPKRAGERWGFRGQGARHRSPLHRFRVEGVSPPKELPLELVVKVCKIKSETPSPVVQNCPDLEQFVKFLKLIEENKADGQAQSLTRLFP